MDFISLVFKNKLRIFLLLVILGLITGTIHVALLIFINDGISSSIQGTKTTSQMLIYVSLVLLIYILLNRYLSGTLIRFSNKVVHDLRMQLMRSVLQSSYLFMKEKSEKLNAAITKDTISAANAALLSLQFITSLVTVAGCLAYIAYLSILAFLILAAITILGIIVYWLGAYKNNHHIKVGRDSEDILFHHTNEVINGFREIKLNPAKGKELVEGPLLKSSLDNYQHMSKGYIGYYNSNIFNQLLFYIVLFVLLFFGGEWLHIQTGILINCIIVALYIVGPLEMIMISVPGLNAGNVAATRLSEIIAAFEGKDEENEVHRDIVFDQLMLKDIEFSFPVSGSSVASKFVLGPVNFVINKAEVVFIYGGNGSGKTTFFHLILGLIKKDHGLIYLNGKSILSEQVINNLFAPVFSDFHLFDKLYGLLNIDQEKVDFYLELFELNGKVTFDNDHFSSLNLSTGQRKRLALIAALLENKPLLFLDEWAADQDPEFRKKFYEVIIPHIINAGFTILAITHDDKYYHTSDVLYRMEFGKLIREK